MSNETTLDLQAVKGFRITSDDYPGALCVLGDGSWRLTVNLQCDRYVAQKRVEGPGGPKWLKPLRAATLGQLIERHGCKVDGLAAVVGKFPDDPSQAAPHVREAVEALHSAFAATDWRREGYGRVVVRDGNLRVVVEPSGEVYRLQWIARDAFLAGPSDMWLTQKMSCDAGDLLRYIELYVWNTESEDQEPCPKLVAALQAAPRFASEGEWPSLPERP